MFSNGNSIPTSFAAINTRDACFVVSKKKADGNGYDKSTFTQMRDVRLTGIKFVDDTFDGKPVRKVRMTYEDGQKRAIVDINAGVYAAAGLLARLNMANLALPLGLTVTQQKKGSTYKKADNTMSAPLSNDITDVSVYQGAYINVPAEQRPPKTVMTKVGNKDVADTSARDAFVNNMVESIIVKLGSGNTAEQTPAQPAEAAAVTTAAAAAEPAKGNFDNFDDDIPF